MSLTFFLFDWKMKNNEHWEEEEEDEEEDLEFSRNYFLAKEVQSSVKKSKRKITDIDVVDEQVPIVEWKWTLFSEFLLILCILILYVCRNLGKLHCTFNQSMKTRLLD